MPGAGLRRARLVQVRGRGPLADQPIDGHRPALPDAVAATHGLVFGRRVASRVE